MARMPLLTLLMMLLALAIPGAQAQLYDDEEEQEPPRQQPIPDAGFWPTQRIMELMIDRVTDELAHPLNLDEDQLYNMRELYKERIPTWLNENRGAIQQVCNEYFEALLERDAPDPLVVAEWADRAQPLFDEFAALVDDTTSEMHPFLTEDQQMMLDAQMNSFRAATGYVSGRLEGWRAGGFDPETEWHRSPQFAEAEGERLAEYHAERNRAEQEALGYDPQSAAAAGPVPHQHATEPRARAAHTSAANDEWARYVDSFIRRYQLNEDQQAKAAKYLSRAQELRDKYLRRNGERLATAKQRVQAATDERARASAQQACEKLERPIQRMFQQLKDWLKRLPTPAQRLAAGQRGLDRDDAPETDKVGGP